MKSNKTKKMKKRILALLLCMVMMLNGSVSALASEVAVANETTALTEATEVAHVHGEECYTRTKVSEEPKCGKEVVEGHTHVDTCYEVTNTQECLCTLEETAGHSHDDSCFETEEIQICTLEEHGHGDGCYTTEKELSCGQEESEEHVHGDECYTETKELNCGTEEHVHGGECYTTETVNTCGQEEKEAHSHGEGCYTTVENKTLICQLEEIESHTHGDDCYEWLEEQVCEIEVEEPAEDKTVAEDQLCVCKNPECPCTTCETECTCEEAEETDEEEVSVCETCQKEECECEKEVENNLIQTLGETTVELTSAKEAFEAEKTYALQVNELEEETAAMVATAIKDAARTANLEVLDYQAFDITLTADEEDAQPKTEVEVKFTGAKIEEYIATEDAEVKAFYVDAEGNVEEIALTEGENEVAITTTHFSTYVVASVKTAEPVVLTTEADGTTITLSGPVSAFAEDKTYEITAAKVKAEEELEVIEEALEEVVEEQEKVVESYQAFDIKIIEKDETGAVTNENFQPLNETPVQVMFSGNEVAESVENEETEVAVFWISDENNVKNMNAVSDETDVVMETDHFSVYVVTEVSECNTMYEELKIEVESFEAQEDWTYEIYIKALKVLSRIKTTYVNGNMLKEQYTDLSNRVDALLCEYSANNPVAEVAQGVNEIEEIKDHSYEGKKWLDLVKNDEKIEENIELSDLQGESSKRIRRLAAWSMRSTLPSEQQIEEQGGKNEDSVNGVSVSKTIAGTDIENVFDITLEVKTNEKISEVYEDPDVAVVIVMDLSYTMNSEYTGTTTKRYDAAIESAGNFLYQFAANTTEDGTSQLGIVGFNTSAHEISALRRCTASDVEEIIDDMELKTKEIVTPYDKERFTNIEAGLKKARDMLATSNCENKYILLLTDGFPTTYIKNGYTGYYTETSSGIKGNDGVFYDSVLNLYCKYGTSYSDKAAIKARQMANDIKSNYGIKIFSVGVDIAGQTIKAYVSQSNDTVNSTDKFSVVDRTSENYEIGDASSTQSYKNWLGNSIGSGYEDYYFDSNNAKQLEDAFNKIFEKIKSEIEDKSAAEWVATDPMPIGSQREEVIEFIKFYNRSGKMVDSLTGEFIPKAENTATFMSDSKTINWDLKKSGYTSETVNGVTTYTYSLVYRVRLRNENAKFVEGTVYDTNNPTSLKYRVTTEINGVNVKSNVLKLDFEIPAVKGYLSELEFKKVDPQGNPVVGATFTLTHDTARCGYCRGDGNSCVTIGNFTATSGVDGNVSFANIPSGHIYTLKETGVPSGYFSRGEVYQVTVAYDKPDVQLIDAPPGWTWKSQIVNEYIYELPSTGGMGTEMYKISGLALMSGAALLLHKKKKDGEVQG